MSGLVFFDDEANNEVIQEWMSSDAAALSASTYAGDIFEAADPSSSSKGGLGFINDKSSNNQSALKDNNRSTEKKISQKKKLSSKFGTEEDYDAVGDDIEESRTSFKSKKEKEAEKVRNKQDIKQQNKKVKIQHNGAHNAASAESVDNNSAISKLTESNKSNVLKEKRPSNNGSSELSADMDTTAETAAAEKRVNSRIRKRTKTRSKQKNIRKDNRSDVHKPAHLVVTNKEYMGRPLTDKTKSILGV